MPADLLAYFRCKRCHKTFKIKCPSKDDAYTVGVSLEEFLAMTLAGRVDDSSYLVCDTCWQQRQSAGVGVGRGRNR